MKRCCWIAAHKGVRVAIRGWVFKHEAEWLAALATLEADGWHAALTCLAAPVQVEGLLPCGEQFYFRARHTEACLAVGGVDPSDVPAWEHCEPYPEASYLPANEGLAILRRLADIHCAGPGKK
jgi:hypothetical protein